MKKFSAKILLLLALVTALVMCVACEEKTTVSGIEIAQNPSKIEYVEGEAFSAEGLQVKVNYSDGTSKTITEGFTVEEPTLVIGSNTVKVTYEGFEATFTVTVKAAGPVEQELQLLAAPAKTVYKAGETFDKTGMEVYVLMSDGTRKAVTDYTVDKTVLTLADTFVTVSYNGLTLKVNVTVNKAETREVEDVILNTDDTMYVPTYDTSSLVKYKVKYTDGTVDEEWTTALADDFEGYTLNDNGTITLKMKLFVKNKLIAKEATYKISTEYVTVAQLLEKGVDGNTYLVDGIVIAFAGTGESAHGVEMVIYDTASGKIVGITGVLSGGTLNMDVYGNGFAVGQRIRVPVKLVNYEYKAGYSDNGKIYAEYAGGTLYATAVIEKKANYTVDLTNAVEVNSQSELEALLGATNRKDNFYKIIKLNKTFQVRRYKTSYFYVGYSGDASPAKIDGARPAFQVGNNFYSLGSTDALARLLVDDASWTATGVNKNVEKDVYVLFIGGNNYYHQFIILDESWIVGGRQVTGTEFKAPDKTEYYVNEELDLTGAKITYTYNSGEPTVVTVTSAMLDATTLPDMTTAGTYEVKGEYEGFKFSFNVTVTVPTATIELASALEKGTYTYFEGLAAVKAELVKLQLNYIQGTTTTKVAITEEMITCEAWAEGEIDIVITYEGATCSVKVTVQAIPETLSVEQARQMPATDKEYTLTGVVVSSAFISGTVDKPANGELLIKDTTTNAIIGVKDIVSTFDDRLAGLAVGDQISVKVTFKVTTTSAKTSECGKIAPYKVEGSAVTVNSKNNKSTIDLSSAVAIGTQAELEAFLKDAETRCGNMYKLVKFAKNATTFVTYKTNKYITFTGARAKIDDKDAFLNSLNLGMTLPGVESFDSVLEIKEDLTVDADVYLLYVGGQGNYYHQFVLLGTDYIVK